MICPKCKHDFISDNRTSQQNKYLHAILGEIADHIGYTINEAKQVLKHELGWYHSVNSVIVYDSTAEMTKEQLADFIDKIVIFASENLGMVIQTPEEYFSNSNENTQ
jgi:hypothetical protein